MSIKSACTTILVGKEASTDGSNMISRTDDAPALGLAKVVIVPACNKNGTWTYVDPDNGCKVELPKRSLRFIALPPKNKKETLADKYESGVNSAGVGISATETISTNEDILAIDPFVKAGLTEPNIPTLVLPYVHTAREGVEWLGKLVAEIGMTSSEAVAFVDEDEIWYMEMYSGHQWAAQRMPANKYGVISNQAMLGFYDADDPENWISSPEIEETARKAGALYEVDGKFHLALSYGTPKRDYNQMRVWAGRRHFQPSEAGEYNVETQYSAFEIPEKKIGLADVFAITRDRYAGTKYDMSAGDIGSDGSAHRPIAIDRTAQSHVIQAKHGMMPIMWSCPTAPEFGIYIPVPANITRVPKALGKSPEKYKPGVITWDLREIADIAATNRESYIEMVQGPFEKLEKRLIKKAARLGAADSRISDVFLRMVTKKACHVIEDVKSDVLTAFSRDMVLATRTLGVDAAADKSAPVKKAPAKSAPVK